MRNFSFCSSILTAAALAGCTGGATDVQSDQNVAAADDSGVIAVSDDVTTDGEATDAEAGNTADGDTPDDTPAQPTEPVIDFSPRLSDANASLSHVSELLEAETRMPITEDMMRTLGTASYAGDFVAANRSGTFEALIGDVAIDVDLTAAPTASGNISNLLLADDHVGGDNNEIISIPTSATVTQLGGSINFDDLSIVSSDNAARLVSNLSGTLTNGATEIDVDAVANLVPTVNDNLVGSIGLSLDDAATVSLWTGVISATQVPAP